MMAGAAAAAAADKGPDFYVGDKSPFMVPHSFAHEHITCTFEELSKNFKPRQSIEKGRWVCDTKTNLVGLCLKQGRVAGSLSR